MYNLLENVLEDFNFPFFQLNQRMYSCQEPLITKLVLEAFWTSLALLVLVIHKCTPMSFLEMTVLWAHTAQESGSGCCQTVESSHTNARPTTLWEQQTAQLLPLLLEVNINNSCTGNVIASKFAPFNMYMPICVPVDCVSVWASKHARRLKTNQGSI